MTAPVTVNMNRSWVVEVPTKGLIEPEMFVATSVTGRRKVPTVEGSPRIEKGSFPAQLVRTRSTGMSADRLLIESPEIPPEEDHPIPLILQRSRSKELNGLPKDQSKLVKQADV